MGVSCRREEACPFIPAVMPNDDPAAGRAAYAKKRKKGKGRKVSKAERERMAAAEAAAAAAVGLASGSRP